jgi:hypothetical protein
MNMVRSLYDFWSGAQKYRVGVGNRIDAVRDGRDEATEAQMVLLESLHADMLALEKRTDKELVALGKAMPIVDQLSQIEGIGFHLATLLVAGIKIERATTVSKLWRYCGYGVFHIAHVAAKGDDKKYGFIRFSDPLVKTVKNEKKEPGPDGKVHPWIDKVVFDGKPVAQLMEEGIVTKVVGPVHEQPIRGQRLHYDERLKTTVYKIGASFMKRGTAYKRIYDEVKVYYQGNRPEWEKDQSKRLHYDLAARRKMEKVFLQHLWLRWRELVGLPTRPLYVAEKLGHTRIYQPEDFGWPILEALRRKAS